MKVMVAVENNAFAHTLSRSLESAGYEVVWACKQEQVLPLMYETRPDLILLALYNLAGDPWELLKKIRLFTETPIVFIADHFTASDLACGAGLGVTDFLSFPGRFLYSDNPVVHQQRGRVGNKGRQPLLRYLTRDHLSKLDRALANKSSQEVWIIKRGNRVRFVARMKSRKLESVRV